ncbi:MAG: methylated-DNA--[Synergistaceae bacterium]|nr:methylated-DNA--[protein]-cysteine S-methyltransferase [Synergistaceae bacterium]
MYTHKYKSPVGDILLSSDGEFLTGLSFKFNPEDYNQNQNLNSVFESTILWLDTYFSGKKPDFTPPFRMTGTDFQVKVWNLLLKIPYGQTTTYGNIASEFAALTGVKHMSAQAVGGAVGRNKIAIIIPCHRVIGSNGNLTGYAGGINIKEKLLMLEKIFNFKKLKEV